MKHRCTAYRAAVVIALVSMVRITTGGAQQQTTPQNPGQKQYPYPAIREQRGFTGKSCAVKRCCAISISGFATSGKARMGCSIC